MHRNGCIPNVDASSMPLPYPELMMGKPDPEDLDAIRSSLLRPFISMATCKTGEDTTDAEMRVYCAYSLPAVVLLFGGENWEKDDLKGCFLDLIGKPRQDETDGETPDDDADNVYKPPLPVKRCLASSIHAVAHMLGPDEVSRDSEFLASFEQTFLRDSDEAIRFNILKNCASFLAALPPGDGEGHRNHYLPVIHSTIMGEDVLGAAKKRSASNPGVLNWRQRDAVAKVLPDLIVLFSPSLNREYIWPILKALLSDSVSAVRENAGWSVPVLLRKYSSAGKKEANAWISEVVTWLKDTLLETNSASAARTSFRRPKKQMVSSEGAFSKRQGYCRICAAVALAMRIGENDDTPTPKYAQRFPVDPFEKLSSTERDRFRSILLDDLLPPALEMTVDCVANVRLTLTKSLKVMPRDILKESRVEEVLNTLEEELMTWDVGDLPLGDMNLSGGSTSPTGGGMMGSTDPPEGVVMTSTMSAC
jgi:serine/threonine-protein phosphatase 4 regulatory subunit 1